MITTAPPIEEPAEPEEPPKTLSECWTRFYSLRKKVRASKLNAATRSSLLAETYKLLAEVQRFIDMNRKARAVEIAVVAVRPGQSTRLEQLKRDASETAVQENALLAGLHALTTNLENS